MIEKNGVSNPECPVCGSPPENPKPREPRIKPFDGCWSRTRNYICTGKAKHAYSTEETYKTPVSIFVKKREGQTEPFDFRKIMESVRSASAGEISDRACKKIAYEVMRNLASMESTINSGVKNRGKLFQASDVGEQVLRSLYLHGNHSAWVRYSLVFYKLDLGFQPNFEKIISVLTQKADCLRRPS